jgi:Cd2+/Zn2+-exporting ATPase
MSTVHASIPIAGMDCPDCARSIERGVAALPGVRDATVNFTAGRLGVEYDAAAIDQDQIVGRVRELGYQTAPGGEAPSGPAAEPSRLAWLADPRAQATIECGLLLAVGVLLDFGGHRTVAVLAFAAAMAIGGFQIARNGLQALRVSRTLDMNALMTIAAVGAAALGDWVEAATVVFLFSLGNSLESFTVDRARGAIRQLMALAPVEARVRRGGHEITVPVGEVRVGDVVRVRPGERIPLDGRVIDGASAVDQAPITGESIPVDRTVGDDVYAGSVNGPSYLEVEATRPYQETTIARIIRLVEEAQSSRAPTQRLVDRFSARYTPAVIALAGLIALGPPLALGQPFEGWIYRALVLLVIACPCALVISTPVAIVAGITRAARDGILIKGGAHLEALGSVRALAVDKTGTVTIGRPDVAAVRPAGRSGGELLALAAAVEDRSEHPFAGAIVRHAHHEGIAIPAASDFEALPGRGVRARVGAEEVLVGSARWLRAAGVDLSAVESALAEEEDAGRTALAVAVDGRAVGLLALADRPRPDARAAVEALHRLGVRPVVMLTGDNPRAAAAIARQLGVDDVRADLLPDDKVAAVRGLMAGHGAVAMLGDGVNDAPALATATVGIAMGAAGTAVAIETADVALMSDDLARVPHAVQIARGTLGTVRTNVAISLATKAIFLALGVAGLAGLWVAVLADMGTSLLVTLNGMRLLRATACDCCPAPRTAPGPRTAD